MGIDSFLPKTKQCWNKAMAEMKGKDVCLIIGQHFQQMLQQQARIYERFYRKMSF